MKTNSFNTAVGAVLLLSVAAFAQPVQKLSESDKDFVIDAAIAGLAEIELGKLAQQNAVSPGVKNFGETLVTDHTAGNKDLEQAVASFHVMLPTQVDAEHQKHLEMLKAKKGAEFDAAFIAHMVEGHDKAIALFKKQAKSGGAAALRDFATRTLPTLEQHLKIAKDLASPKTSGR